MNFYNIFKKIISFILLYTILISNTSTFYIFANEIETTTTQNQKVEITTEQDKVVEKQPEDPLNLNAKSAVLIDAKTGIVIYDKEKDIKSFPASTTKILTALLTIKNTKPEDILTHSHNAIYNIGPGSSHIGMRENEKITIDQSLYGVLLASANEVCMALAEHVSGSVDKFVDEMNKFAKEIGAKNTHFANPHGFHDENHYTTSYDMALLMKEAIKNESFVKYISTPTYTIPKTNIVNEERILNNSNKMILKTSPYYYQYTVGGKTGYTSEAGNTLVTYAKKDNIELISVVMQDQGFKVYDDTKALFEYGFENYEQKQIFSKEGYKTKSSVIQKFKDKEIPLDPVYLLAEDNVSLNLPKNVDVSKITNVVNVKEPVIAPINVGDKIGSLDFFYDNNLISSVPLVAENKVDIIPEKKLQRKETLTNVFNTIVKVLKYAVIIIVIVAIIFFIVALITRNMAKAKRNRNRMRRYGHSNGKLKPMKKKRKK